RGSNREDSTHGHQPVGGTDRSAVSRLVEGGVNLLCTLPREHARCRDIANGWRNQLGLCCVVWLALVSQGGTSCVLQSRLECWLWLYPSCPWLLRPEGLKALASALA